MLCARLVACGDGFLRIHAENRFCHTDLSEVRFLGWYCGKEKIGDRSIEACRRACDPESPHFCVAGPQTGPFESGILTLPLMPGEPSDYLYLEARDAFGNPVDEYLLELAAGQENASVPETSGALSSPHREPSDRLRFVYRTPSGLFCVTVSETTGMLTEISVDGKPAVSGGPMLHIPCMKPGDWELSSLELKESDSMPVITASGRYGGKIAVTYTYRIDPGVPSVTLSWRVDAVNTLLPYRRKLRVGMFAGGLDELGITLCLPAGTDMLSWSRLGDFSIYPEDSIGRNAGFAQQSGKDGAFGEAPLHPWRSDARHDMLNGRYDPGIRGSNDFTSLKGNILQAALSSSDKAASPFRILPAGSDALHLRTEGCALPEQLIPCDDPRLHYEGCWYNLEDTAWNAPGKERLSNAAGSRVTCAFRGSGIIWYGSVDVNYGKAAVFVDGVKQPLTIDQRVDGVDFSGSSVGFDRKYHYPVFSVKDLPDGDHTLTIEVLGEHRKDSCDSYIAVESFCVLPESFRPAVKLYLLKDYNYPRISWGNWKKAPVGLKEGDGQTIELRF